MSKADYVVVGVGTAGGAMAKLLSDDMSTSVIALHNGANLTDDPTIALSKNSIKTVLDALIGPPFYENGLSVDDHIWAIANPGGGASSINAGAWARGTNQCFSKWEALAGPEWTVDRIIRTYKRLEDYKGVTTDIKARGYHGPIEVQQIAHPSKVSEKFTRAEIKATGFPFVLDYNDPDTPVGVSSQFQYTHSGPEGKYRVSSMNAFLNDKVITPDGQGVNGRKLQVLFDTFALRAIWSDTSGTKVVGVEYLQRGKQKSVCANKGVIVCAGLRSSVFLLQSGVGPESLLTSLNIPVKYANPNVGQHLVDQPRIAVFFTSNPLDFPKDRNAIFAQIAWLPSPTGAKDTRICRMATTNPIPGITIMVFDLVQATMKGSVSISSNDPQDPPVVDYNFVNPDDVATFLECLRAYLKPTAEILPTIDPTYNMIYPPLSIFDDPPALRAFVVDSIGSNVSPQCHCRMAPLDRGGVIDGMGKVYGVDGLYVADDSSLPTPMDGSPMATAYLMAANIARQIHPK
jgi:choline dehydrogenase-like flavoprotein